jgi:glycerophosphoryl diester phosphodiesterase
MQRVPEWLVRAPVAHRGLHDAARGIIENSLPAFRAAARGGYPAELDVRLLADGEVVVFHDRTLERMTNRAGDIESRTTVELRDVFLQGAAEDPRIPLLREVLDTIAGATPLLVEIKNEGDVGALEEAVASLLDDYRGPYAVQSFHPGTVRFWREHRPDACRGLLSGDFRHEPIDDATRERLRNLDALDECAPDFIGYDIRLLPNDAVTRASARGLPVIGWTARSLDEAARALDHCANVIFEGFDGSLLRRSK